MGAFHRIVINVSSMKDCGLGEVIFLLSGSGKPFLRQDSRKVERYKEVLERVFQTHSAKNDHAIVFINFSHRVHVNHYGVKKVSIMSIKRIYHEDRLLPQQRFALSAEASHHVNNVLRMNVGQHLVLFDGLGFEYQACIKKIDKKSVIVHVLEKLSVQRESPLQLELAQGISRGDRMDYVIQKAVELGVNVITPIFSERCNVKFDQQRLMKKMQHWQAILIGASEQSGRTLLPTLNQPQTLSSWLAVKQLGLCLVCSPEKHTELTTSPQTKVTLLIGPEGGLTDAELELAQQNGYQFLQLGPRILRTETAAVTALTAAQLLWGDVL